MSFAPLALFVYRRCDHTRATVDALVHNPEAAATDLFVFSDGARDASAEGEVAQVRQYVRQLTGFGSVTVIERSRNLGLAGSIIEGVTQLCTARGRVVVVEDDLVVSRHFLGYMNHALERYADDERVMQVSGYMFPVSLDKETDALFLPLTTSWGWACWQRSWRHFDARGSGRTTVARDRALRLRFNLDGAYDYAGMLEAQAAGKLDSWAIRWYLSVFLRGGLVLYPARTLVRNLGFDDSGTHGVAPPDWGQIELEDAFCVRRYPDLIEVSPEFGKIIECVRRTTSRESRSIKGLLHGLLAKAKGSR